MIEWPHKQTQITADLFFAYLASRELSCPHEKCSCGDTRNFCSYSRQFRALVVILCYVTSALSIFGATGLMIDFCIYPRHVPNTSGEEGTGTSEGSAGEGNASLFPVLPSPTGNDWDRVLAKNKNGKYTQKKMASTHQVYSSCFSSSTVKSQLNDLFGR